MKATINQRFIPHKIFTMPAKSFLLLDDDDNLPNQSVEWPQDREFPSHPRGLCCSSGPQLQYYMRALECLPEPNNSRHPEKAASAKAQIILLG